MQLYVVTINQLAIHTQLQKLLHYCIVDYSDCSTAQATIQEHYDKLIRLPVDSLLPSLYAYNVVTFDQKEEIEELPQKKKRMDFIASLIIRSLDSGVADLYNRFLKVLKESEDLPTRELAKKLGKLIATLVIFSHSNVMYVYSSSSVGHY